MNILLILGFSLALGADPIQYQILGALMIAVALPREVEV